MAMPRLMNIQSEYHYCYVKADETVGRNS